MSFSGAAFAETSFTEDSEIASGSFGGGTAIIYFNSDTLTFPLRINKLSSLDLKINKLNNLSLNINKLNDFELKINTMQGHSLNINKILDFTTRR